MNPDQQKLLLECELCPQPVKGNGLCRSCAAKNRAAPTKRLPRTAACLNCGTGITATSTGRCRSCAAKHFNALPETAIKRSEGWRRAFATKPGLREAARLRAARNARKAMTDPAKRAAAAERGRVIYELYLNTPEARAKVAATRKQAGEKTRERLLAWCPPKYRELHRANVHSRRMKAADSRAQIEAVIAAEKKRPKTFEEQLAAIAEGRATIYTVTRASNDPEFTLGGVSSGWAA